MMLNDTTFDYLYEFYGNSAKGLAIFELTISLFTIISNIFFITLTLTTPSLRKNSTNWFLLGFSISDSLHSLAHFGDAYALWYGSLENRRLCAVAGMFVVSTVTGSFGFPALIAAERYYKINTIPQSTGFSIGRAIFADRAVIPLMVVWFFLSIVLNLPLLLNDAWGEDPSGFCGAKRFTSVPLLLSYELSVMLVFAVSMTVTAIYYYRLVAWLKQHQASLLQSSNETVDYTSSVMRVVKIVTLVPLIVATPCVILSAGQMILPQLPMWINRLLISPFLLSSAANPWLTIGLVRQFRVRFLELVSKAKNPVTKSIVELHNRSNTPVRRI
uniref:G-protein coupled receptors family 1 profile domain-containing protein n=1 Tax=Plectus sambesii TaxID=2011161 RepID=A0A914ULU9_9BILA